MGCSFQSAGKIQVVILDRNKKPKKGYIIIYFSSRWTKKRAENSVKLKILPGLKKKKK